MKKQNVVFSVSGVIIFIAIIVFVNLISQYLFIRLDFTQGGIYSITKSTKKILRNLPEKVLVKAYFTQQLPPEYSNNYRYLADLLDEYKTYSRGKISYEFIDPAKSKDRMNEVYSLGIMPVKFQQIEQDKYEVREGFMGIAFLCNDKTEVIPFVKNAEGLEYDITSKIKKLISSELKTVAFITGHNEITDQMPQEFSQYISQNYNSRQIDLKTGLVSPEISCLVIAGPKRPLTDTELFVLEQFIMSGKPVGLMIDSYEVNFQNFYVQPVNSGINKLLEYYGIRIIPGLVIDAQNQRIAIQSNQGGFNMQNIVNYPYMPLVTDLKRQSPILRNLDAITLPFVSPVEIVGIQALNVTVLAKSSTKSYLNDKTLYSVSPYEDFRVIKDLKQGPFNLAVLIEPKPKIMWKSYYSDKMTPELQKLCGSSLPVLETQNLGRIVFIPSSSFISRDPAFFMNTLDWLAQDESMISIRSKETGMKPLRNVPIVIRYLLKYFAVFIMPVLVILAGFVLFKRRKLIRKTKEEQYLN